MTLRLITLLLLTNFFWMPSARADLDCRTLLSQMVKHPLRHEERIVLVPGKIIEYRIPNTWRLFDAYIEVNANDDLEAMAKVLAQGGPYEEILKKLRKNALEYPTEISLKELTPQIVAERTNQFPECDGPNCWNATLNWFDPSVGIKNTTLEEITAILKDTTQFVRLEEGQQLEFGDVMVVVEIDGNKTEIQHTAIYLNEHIVWHKARYTAGFPWTFERMEDALKIYSRFYNPVEVWFFRRVKRP